MTDDAILLGETRPKLPIDDGLENLGLVLAASGAAEAFELAVFRSLYAQAVSV